METNLKNLKPDVRRLNDMKEVLYDKEWAESVSDFDVYYMYRAVKEGNDLRYDITIIPHKMLGSEFVKTKGNRNSDNFLEIYTVLQGEAIFLLQKTEKGEVKDVFAIKAKKGQSVIDPAGYYIVSINSSKKLLKLGNWVPGKNKNIYEEIERMKGACYFYILRPDSGQAGWVKNKNYKNIPKLRFEKPLKTMPKDLRFLKG